METPGPAAPRGVAALAVVLLAALGGAARPARADDACARVRAAIRDELERSTELAALRPLGPKLDAAGALVLVERIRQGKGAGLLPVAAASHESVVLEMLRPGALPAVPREERSLAAFVLGSAVETATITRLLDDPDVARRRVVVETLAAQRNVLSRALLERALADPEPALRRVAAEALVRRGRMPRAARLLSDLAPSLPPDDARATWALLRETRATASWDAWAPWSRAPVAVELALRGRSDLVRVARADVASTDAERRAIALAILAATGEGAAALEARTKKARERFGPSLEAPLAALAVLGGDEAAWPRLEAVGPAERPLAALAWVAYAGVGRGRAALPPARAARLVSTIATWTLAPADERELLAALSTLVGPAALTRAHALVTAGRALVPALALLAREGGPDDLSRALDGATRLAGADRGRVLAELAGRCRR